MKVNSEDKKLKKNRKALISFIYEKVSKVYKFESLIKMRMTLKKKIELSNFLEQIETNRNSEKVINKLDLMHSNLKHM